MGKSFIWLALVISFVCIQITGQWTASESTERFLVPPPEHIEHFHFGFPDSMADSFWLRWIQDSDYCQTYLQPVETYEPKNTGDRLYNPRYKNCDNSWSFKMLDTVTKLAPRFRMPFVTGGISLSVLTEDFAGATVIFDRGVNSFPEDWDMAYRAAYHYLFDLQKKERAAELLIQAGKYGAPDWVNLLAARLYSMEGRAELGLTVLEAYRRQLEDPEQIKHVQSRIDDLKKQLRGQ